MKRVRSYAIALLGSFIIALLLGCGYNNMELIQKSAEGYKNNGVQLTDLKSESRQLKVKYSPINSRVSYIALKLDMEEAKKSIRIFYNSRGSEDFNEEPIVINLTKDPSGIYTFPVNINEQVDSLLMEIPVSEGENIIPGNIEINTNVVYKQSFKAVALIFVLVFMLYLLIFIKPKYFNLDLLYKYRYIIAVITFAILVAFKLHGSSVGIWDDYIKDTIKPSNEYLLFGKERAIRSDEWLVQTPAYLSQENNDDFFEIVNDNIRSDGQNALLAYNSPVLDITLLGKPLNWGFILFDGEHALSWYWCLKIILLLLFSLELGFLITKDKGLAFLMGMLITLGAPTQWWFNTSVVDLTIYALGLIFTFWRYLISDYEDIKQRLVMLIVFLICAIGFVVTLYPAIQVPLGYLVLIFFFYIAIKNRKSIVLKKRDIIMIGAALFIFLAAIGSFVFNSLDAISITLNTAYPGKRSSQGGSYSFKQLFSYLVAWLLPFKDINYLNSSEVSAFTILIPEILFGSVILLGSKRYKAKEKTLISMLLIYSSILLSYMFISYPKIIAKATLLSFAYEPRLIVPLGIAGIILMVMLLRELEIFRLKPVIAIAFTSVVIGFYYLIIKGSFMGSYLNNIEVIITLVIFALLSLVFLLGKKKLFVFVMTIFMVITGATVNPIARGLNPLYNKTLSREIVNINEEEEGIWAATDNGIIANFIIAQGVRVFNGVHYYPDLDLWKTLDSEGKFEEIYNRYAHITLALSREETSFRLLAPDAFEVNLSYDDFDKTDIKYLVTSRNLSSVKASGGSFKELYYSEIDNLYIFKYTK